MGELGRGRSSRATEAHRMMRSMGHGGGSVLEGPDEAGGDDEELVGSF